ncbi:MAG TPA: hypothetical protein VEJ63_14575 [Planctomycetota bacterium]|nr:hypothetical protein [Planctomycetota bacterium]
MSVDSERPIQNPKSKIQNRFAWDGVSFSVPAHWNLSGYTHDKLQRRVEMEDDFAHRLDVEWMFSNAKLNPATIEKRYMKSSKALTRSAKETIPLAGLPGGWAAFLYSFADGRKLVTAWALFPEQKFFIIFLLHFERQSPEDPERLVLDLASSLELHTGALIPWECYDIAFEVPKAFKLEKTEFLAGRKLFQFQWRGRRLYVWFFSLADLLLKKRSLNEWAAEFLSGQPGLRGPRYEASGSEIVATRRRWRPIHADQLASLCFRYRCGVRHDAAANRITLWAFHHRRARDMEQLNGFSLKLDDSHGPA